MVEIRKLEQQLLAARAEIEKELGLSMRPSRNGRTPQTQASRAARAYWKEHAQELQVTFRASGPIPLVVQEAHAAKR